MRVMVLIKANKDTEAGVLPSEELLRDMGNFNEELVKAGVMLAGEGLHPTSKGVRVKFSGRDRTVTDGPFAETKEQLGGFFLISAGDLNEAIQVASKFPSVRFGTMEVRPVRDIPGSGH